MASHIDSVLESSGGSGPVAALLSADWPTRIALTLGIIAVVSVLRAVIVNRYFSPISHVPGPFWASVTRLYLVYYHLKGVELQKMKEWHAKYGPIFRVTPTLLMVDDPTELPKIYRSREEKTAHYSTGSWGEPTIPGIRSHKEHVERKRALAPAYAFSNVKAMESRVDEQISEWINELDTRFVQTGKEFDFAPWTTYLAYDIISEMSFGEPMGFSKSGTDLFGLIEGFHTQQPIAGVMVRLHPFFNWLRETGLAGKFLLPKPTDKTGYGRLMDARDKIMAEFEATPKEKRNNIRGKGRAFLEMFYNEEIGTKDTGTLTKEAIKSEALLLLIVGSDTTSTAMQALLIGILSTPHIYTRVMAELSTLPTHQTAQYDTVISSCPYYISCVKEAIRLTPSAPTYFPRHPPASGLDICGTFVPGGKGDDVEVGANPYITQRNKEVYGADADEFLPERWLESGEEAVAAMERYEFTFGYGSRGCIGKSLAFLELYKSPVEFLRTFKVNLANEKEPATLVYKGGVFWHKDFYMNLERRKYRVVSEE